jgi:hypothetical protein
MSAFAEHDFVLAVLNFMGQLKNLVHLTFAGCSAELTRKGRDWLARDGQCRVGRQASISEGGSV